jgi:N-acetylglucosaminyldiphosphoundecaprenol N-acetyl-beta-D-mannosaminyltransferase
MLLYIEIMDTIKLFGYKILNGEMAELLNQIDKFLKKDGFKRLVTLNPEMVIQSYKNKAARKLLKQADMRVIDGVGLQLLGTLMKKARIVRHPGVEIVSTLFEKSDYSFFLIGADKDVIKEAVKNIKRTYQAVNIVGYTHGYYKEKDEAKIIQTIKERNPDIVLVALGFPKQEEFLEKLKGALDRGVGIGVGGVFDVISGSKKRAPKWMQTCGIEWLYRGLKEPKRIKRWWFIPIFIVLAIPLLIIAMLGFFIRKKR